MREKQDNKPDFLRDIDEEIFKEMTAGGIRENAVGLAGEVKELEEVSQICGLPFNGYLGKVETPRPKSGIVDEVVIAFREQAVDRGQTGDGLHLENYFTTGSRLLITGTVQTLKDFQSDKVLVFILADYAGLSEKAMMQDDVALKGTIANQPTYRETPRGKRITDITIKCRNVITGGWCFVPCICWQEQADEVANWQQGDTVELLGRYQSREYDKAIEKIYADGVVAETVTERRTAYEVSVRQIGRIGEAENEK